MLTTLGRACVLMSEFVCEYASMHIATSTRLDQAIPRLFQVKPYSSCLKHQQAQTDTDS